MRHASKELEGDISENEEEPVGTLEEIETVSEDMEGDSEMTEGQPDEE